MKLSLINVFRNTSFEKIDWLTNLFFGVGFMATIFILIWLKPNFSWYTTIFLPFIVGIVAQCLSMVTYSIYKHLNNNI